MRARRSLAARVAGLLALALTLVLSAPGGRAHADHWAGIDLGTLSGTRAGVGSAAARSAAARAATARRLTLKPSIHGGPSWGTRLADKLTLAGDEVGLQLRAITFNTLDLDFNGHTNIAHLKLMAGDPRALALHLRGVIAFKDGYARVATRLDLSLAGKHLALALPQVDMVPGSVSGRRYVELRVPVVDMHF